MIVARGLGKGSSFGGLSTFGMGVGGLLSKVLKSISIPWNIRQATAAAVVLPWSLGVGEIVRAAITLSWNMVRPVIQIWAQQAEAQNNLSVFDDTERDVWVTKK